MCAFLANGLSARGWSVTVCVTLSAGQRWANAFHSGVNLRFLGTQHARRSIRAVVRVVRDIRPATVLAFNYQMASLLPLVRRRSGVRFRAVGRTVVALSTAARDKSFWQRTIVMRFVRRRYRQLDAVIAQAHAMRSDLEENFGVAGERIAVIHNPAAGNGHPSPEADQRPYPPVPTLLYVGRFKPQKQPLALLDLIGELRSRGHRGVRLLAAGEGPLLDAFRRSVRDRGLDDVVDYRGYVDDTAALFSEARVTVLVSRYEGFPNILVESLSHGVPVASYDCPTGPSEIVVDGTNGRIVAPDDLPALADAVAGLLDHPPDRAAVRATASRWDPERILDQYEEVLS